MNIIIPMAGRGTRVNGDLPKPLVEIYPGKTMIQMAIETLDIDANYHFIIRKYDSEQWNEWLYSDIKEVIPNATVTQIDYVTDGPAITALLAPYTCFRADPLIIANCDQIMAWDSSKFIEFTQTTDADGAVVTYETDTPKNSYALISDEPVDNSDDPHPIFEAVREKEVVSKYSLNGVHWWKHGALFYKSAHIMINCNERTNNEFYVGPTYTFMFNGVKRVYNIPTEQHWAIGTTEDIQRYKERFPIREH